MTIKPETFEKIGREIKKVWGEETNTKFYYIEEEQITPNQLCVINSGFELDQLRPKLC